MIFATYWFLAFAILFFPSSGFAEDPLFTSACCSRFGSLPHPLFWARRSDAIVAMGVIVYFIGLSDNRAANAVGIILCVLMLVG